MTLYSKKTWLVYFAYASLAFFALVAIFIWFFGPPDTSEFGPIETGEHIVLVAGIWLWVRSALWQAARPVAERRVETIVAVGLVIVYYAALGRELTWLKVYGFPYWRIVEAVSAVVGIGALLGVAFVYFVRTPNLWRRIRAFLGTPVFMLLCIAAFLGFAGEAFEKGHAFFGASQFWEELVEFWGYIALLLAPISTLGKDEAQSG